MKYEIIKLKPHFEYRVWANNNIKKEFNLQEDNIGEAWIISAFNQKSSVIENNNQSLYDFYKNKENAYFFNSFNLKNEYPLLTKIIDAKDDLSVQIHPDDKYAEKYNSLGKTECWYILDTKENNYVILGHNAKDINEFQEEVKNKNWDSLLKKRMIKKNDFVYVESTKIHAIKADTLVFELQQSSDITYRIYDYDRLDKGKPRELHLDQVYDLIKFPDKEISKSEISNQDDFLVSNNLFNLKLIENDSNQEYEFKNAQWLQVTIIEGEGKINNLDASKYDSFLISYGIKMQLNGKMKCLVSFISK